MCSDAQRAYFDADCTPIVNDLSSEIMTKTLSQYRFFFAIGGPFAAKFRDAMGCGGLV